MQLTLNTAGGVHRNDPDTSRAAAARNSLRSGTQRTRVMAVVAAHPNGLTAEEVTHLLGMREATSGSSAAKRLSELKAAGMVIATGQTRATVNGSQANVWVATVKGHDALSAVA